MDDLIQDIAEGRRIATQQETEQLRSHIATAPFNTQRVRVAPALQGVTYHGRTLQRYDDSGFAHLVKRVMSDRQWTDGVTLDQFVASLRRFVKDPRSDLVIFKHGRRYLVAFVGENTLPASLLGSVVGEYLFVLYAVDRSAIITGYQTRSIEALHIPDDAIWLT